jgi:hypothetical protein
MMGQLRLFAEHAPVLSKKAHYRFALHACNEHKVYEKQSLQ